MLKNFYSGTMKPMHPKILHGLIVKNNAAIFNAFIEFPKPVSLSKWSYMFLMINGLKANRLNFRRL